MGDGVKGASESVTERAAMIICLQYASSEGRKENVLQLQLASFTSVDDASSCLIFNWEPWSLQVTSRNDTTCGVVSVLFAFVVVANCEEDVEESMRGEIEIMTCEA